MNIVGFVLCNESLGLIFGLPVHNIWVEVDALIYAFHMPLFFALSGWFYVRSITKKDFSGFVANRLERILYPMILWTYIFFAFKTLAGSYVNSPITTGDFPLIPIPGMLHFWFLWDLMILSIIAYPLRFALRNEHIVPSVWVLAVIVVLVLQFIPLPTIFNPWCKSAISNAPFFLLGAVLGQTKGFVPIGTRGLIALASIFAVVLAIHINLAHPDLRNIGSFVLVVCALGLLRGIESRCPEGLRSALAHLGIASMTIYVAHTIFSAAFREALMLLTEIDPLSHILVGTIIGILGPLALLLISRYFGMTRILGLEVRTVPSSNSSS